MKILYLAHRIPYPPNKGDKIRSYHTIKHLAKRHEVWCACFVDDPRDFAHVEPLAKICREVVALPLRRGRAVFGAALNLAIDESASQGFYRSAAMARAVTELSRKVGFDALLVYSSSMAPYAGYVQAGRKVIDLCDLDSRKWADLARVCPLPKRWILQAEALRLAEAECVANRRFDATVLVGQHEAEGWNPPRRDRVHFICNGVNVPPEGDLGSYESLDVGFVGDMGYLPNEQAVLWFAREVWPAVRGSVDGARFVIVGRSPSRRVRGLAGVDGVDVIGEVPEVGPHLARLRCAVAPLLVARGIQNKVLEAMAAARPVVATSRAAAGIDCPVGSHLSVADQPREYAAAVVGLLADPERAREIGLRARRFVQQRHDWNVQMSRMESLLTDSPSPYPAPSPGLPAGVR
jgi:sugar transferase (PEP-CTERM/EpsH1 system associated)